MGASFPMALENHWFSMLRWVTADFWEAALGFKDSTSFSQGLLWRERRRSAVPAQALWIWLFTSTPGRCLAPGVLRGCPGCGLSPPWVPRDTARWVLGLGTAATPRCVAGGKMHPGVSQCPGAPPSSRKTSPN